MTCLKINDYSVIYIHVFSELKRNNELYCAFKKANRRRSGRNSSWNVPLSKNNGNFEKTETPSSAAHQLANAVVSDQTLNPERAGIPDHPKSVPPAKTLPPSQTGNPAKPVPPIKKVLPTNALTPAKAVIPANAVTLANAVTPGNAVTQPML